MSAVETQELDQFELTCTQLIAQVGLARSCYVEAIACAEKGDFAGAERSFDEGDAAFHEGHEVHMGLLQREASGEALPFSIIVLHAEDLMTSAETLRILAEKFVNVYRKLEED